MRMRSLAKIITVCAPLAASTTAGFACLPENPAKYFSRNACDFLNCEVLFWVEDVFPLSERPASGGGSSEAAAAEEEGGGH